MVAAGPLHDLVRDLIVPSRSSLDQLGNVEKAVIAASRFDVLHPNWHAVRVRVPWNRDRGMPRDIGRDAADKCLLEIEGKALTLH